MIKIKNGALVILNQVVSKVIQTSGFSKVTINLIKIRDELVNNIKTYDEARMLIFKETSGTPNNETKQYEWTDEANKILAMEKLAELNNQEIKLNIEKIEITLNDKAKKTLSGSDLEVLYSILKDSLVITD